MSILVAQIDKQQNLKFHHLAFPEHNQPPLQATRIKIFLKIFLLKFIYHNNGVNMKSIQSLNLVRF